MLGTLQLSIDRILSVELRTNRVHAEAALDPSKISSTDKS